MLDRISWPPNYDVIRRNRMLNLEHMHRDPKYAAAAKHYYATAGLDGCLAFIEDWCDTFDTRNAMRADRPTTMPFILFPKQIELVEFLYVLMTREANGLIEKSRDMGATWIAVSFAVWAFLFIPGANIGFGSRVAPSVDKLGDMSSIFEKIRFQLRSVPRLFWPAGFGEENMAYMKVHAPNGNSIVGEVGDNIGRGGRTLMYFKDESAHYEHPELIEAALGDNTRVQVDISSVNGMGNVFHRRRDNGIEWSPGNSARRDVTNVFIMDWRDHPDKTEAWYNERRNKAIGEGLLHKFKQEVDRDYAGAVDGVIIPREWVMSAVDAHIKLGWIEDESPVCFAGLDVADSGDDRNALAIREGTVVKHLEMWGERDTGATTRKAVTDAKPYARKRRRVHMMYDSVGVGAGVKAESNRLKEETDDEGNPLMPKYIGLVSWNGGYAVLRPDDRVVPDDEETPKNKDFYRNLKAQGWWQLRLRFERTHRAVTEGVQYDPDELISLPRDLNLRASLEKELSQPTISKDSKLKMVIDKAPEGTKSPNLADAIMMMFWPVEELSYGDDMDWV